MSTMPAAQPSLALWMARASDRADLGGSRQRFRLLRREAQRLPLDARRCAARRRAAPSPAIGGSRDRNTRFMPCGISRSPSAKAKRHAASALGSWKLSTTSSEPGGKQREELAQEAPRERRQVARVLGGEHRQRGGIRASLRPGRSAAAARR